MIYQKKISRIFFPLMIVVITILLAVGVGTAETKKNLYEKAKITARTEIWQDINTGKASSATVAIMDQGKVVYNEGFGMADREQSIPVTPDTLFNIGSVSKVFTATAVMLLVDEGKIKLDNPIMQYLPEFVMADSRYREITVRMLLNHTSGLPGSTLANTVGYEYNTRVNQDIIENISHSHLIREPGAMAVYCNDGFSLAEMIVEEVSGEKYIEFLKERIFKPLSLKNTGLGVGERMDTGKVIAAYYDPETGKKEPLETVSLLGAGGLGSTVIDLCQFADSFSGSGSRILSKAALTEMRKAQPSLSVGKLKHPDFPYGLGWDYANLPRYQAAGIKILGKSGDTVNYSAIVFTVPARRLSVAVIASGTGARVSQIALDILESLLVQKGLVEKVKSPVSRPLEPKSIPREYISYNGYYANSGGELYHLKVNRDNERVVLFAVNQDQEVPVISFFYNQGYLYTSGDGENQSYLKTVDDKTYYVISLFGNDLIQMQKIDEIQNPKKLEIDVNGKLWLRRNVRPYSGKFLNNTHLIKSFTLEALPGYVEFGGIKEIKSPTFAGIPVGAVRDQTELTLLNKDNGFWARVSAMLYSPSSEAGVLKSGKNSVTITGNGYNEWLRVDQDSIVSFQIPVKGRIIIFSPEGTPVYDSIMDKGDVFIKQGSYLEIVGNPGAIFNISSK